VKRGRAFAPKDRERLVDQLLESLNEPAVAELDAAWGTEIERRLAEVRAYEQGNRAFLSEADPNAASAALIQRLKQSMTDHAKDEQRCQNVSTQSFNSGTEELYQRVTVQARLKCDLEPFAAVLYDLENGKPYLFVDQVMIYKQQSYSPPGVKVVPNPLDVRFNLSGYLRQPGKTAK
jgi:general secretion pathway protein M